MIDSISSYFRWPHNSHFYFCPIHYIIISFLFFIFLFFLHGWVISLHHHFSVMHRIFTTSFTNAWTNLMVMISNQLSNSCSIHGNISFRQLLIMHYKLFCINAFNTFPFNHLQMLLMHVQNSWISFRIFSNLQYMATFYFHHIFNHAIQLISMDACIHVI